MRVSRILHTLFAESVDEATLIKYVFFNRCNRDCESGYVHSAGTTRVAVSKLLGQAVTACCSVDRIIMFVLVKVMLNNY